MYENKGEGGVMGGRGYTSHDYFVFFLILKYILILKNILEYFLIFLLE